MANVSLGKQMTYLSRIGILSEFSARPICSNDASSWSCRCERRRPSLPLTAPPKQLRLGRKSCHYVQSELTQEEETRKINFNRHLSANSNMFTATSREYYRSLSTTTLWWCKCRNLIERFVITIYVYLIIDNSSDKRYIRVYIKIMIA